jgi:hypothetical protein
MQQARIPGGQDRRAGRIGGPASLLAVKAADLLLSENEVRSVLGPSVRVSAAVGQPSPESIGEVLRAAAVDSAYARFGGASSSESEERPVAVGLLALVFDSPTTAGRTFDQVSQAAHMRTEIDECSVAVETVSGAGGLVSYWGFVHRGSAIVVVTLDTVDPQTVSMTQFRSLAIATAERLAAA